MFKKRFSLAGLIMACLITCGALVGIGVYWLNGNIGSVSDLFKLARSAKLIQKNYVGDVASDVLYEGALRGMVKSLDDPHSVYLDKKDFAHLAMSTEGHFSGIGAVLSINKEKVVVVVAPIDDSPADKAGLVSGDHVLAVDGQKTAGMELEDVVKLIRGANGTQVELLVQTGSEAARKVTITRSDIKLKSVSGEMKDGDIGYIRITSFSESTAADFRQKYAELAAAGMQGLVLDLRGNPGGLLDAGVNVAKLLVPKGPIVSVTEKSGRTLTEYSNLPKVKYPAAVLVDKGTASAAEIVAGAMQDTKAGKLFGTKTYGKGSVQTIFRVSSGTGIKLTMAKYFTPSGRSINGVGIEPDVVIEPEDVKGSNQLKAALTYVQEVIGQVKSI